MEDFFTRFGNMTGIQKISNSEIPVPLGVSDNIVSLLDIEMFNPESRFLDISCKSGRLLISIYNKLYSSKYLSHMDEATRRRHILDNQLYAICSSIDSAMIVRKQLYGDPGIIGKTIYIDNYTNRVNRDLNRILELILKEFNGMKFDVVVGNPPYNNDIYLDFVTLADKLTKTETGKILMVTPAKWQAKTDSRHKSNSGGLRIDKNETFRQNMVPRTSKIVFYKDAQEVFDIVENGGISYFLIDRVKHDIKQIKTICSINNSLDSNSFEDHDEKTPVLLSHRILSVIDKIGTLGDGFRQSLYIKNTDHGENSIIGTLGFRRQEFTGEQDRGEYIPQGPIKGRDYVEVMQGEKIVGYKAIKDLNTTDNLDKYKCIASCMMGYSAIFNGESKVYGSPYINIIGPNQVPKGSFMVLKYANTLNEAESFRSYIQSKLVSFLFFLGICGATMTKEFFRYVPDPNDWMLIYEDEPLPGYIPDENGVYIDSDGKKHCALYNKYKLDESDIELVESIIKVRK